MCKAAAPCSCYVSLVLTRVHATLMCCARTAARQLHVFFLRQPERQSSRVLVWSCAGRIAAEQQWPRLRAGTVVKRKGTGQFLGELLSPGDRLLVVRGGRGGRGVQAPSRQKRLRDHSRQLRKSQVRLCV
jgi:hypothetical protein